MNIRCYDDIIDLPHHVSASHPQMPLSERAAQFAPFKALTGYEDDINETARLTDGRIEPGEARIEQLDARLQLLYEHIGELPEVSITHFVPDSRKSGGSYVTVSGRAKKIDTVNRAVILSDGQRIAIGNILEITGGLFAGLD